jgi:hypothetical protein
MMRKAGGEQPVHLSSDPMLFPCGGVCGSVDLNLFMQSSVRKAGEGFDDWK